MQKRRILVFPCGTEVGLEINRSFKGNCHFELVGASSVDDHGKFVYKEYIGGLPFLKDPSLLDKLREIVKKYDIDMIFPAHDDAINLFSEAQGSLKAKVIASPFETCEICRSKRKTYNHLQGVIKVPQIFDSVPNVFPVFAKPDKGQGSRGAMLINNIEDYQSYIRTHEDYLICEFLPGKEYTVDCFTDRHGNLRIAKGRERRRVNNGISVNSRNVDFPIFYEMAQKINGKLKLRGAWFFQVKIDTKGNFCLLEVASRIAGTMGLFRANGVNFAQLSAYDFSEHEIEIIESKNEVEIDRSLSACYSLAIQYSTIYVDFDDTIIQDGQVAGSVIGFLYDSIGIGKRVILLSRHSGDIKKSLTKYKLSPSLFDEIIILKTGEKKSSYIKDLNSIFIDDSFAERLEVSKAKGIPVFGLDSIEALRDFKI